MKSNMKTEYDDNPLGWQNVDIMLRKADGACLLWEVVYFSLWHMKENPELSEEEALELGYHEWMK